MKKFEMPEIQVEVFSVEDVVTTSGGNGTMLPDQGFEE